MIIMAVFILPNGITLQLNPHELVSFFSREEVILYARGRLRGLLGSLGFSARPPREGMTLTEEEVLVVPRIPDKLRDPRPPLRRPEPSPQIPPLRPRLPEPVPDTQLPKRVTSHESMEKA